MFNKIPIIGNAVKIQHSINWTLYINFLTRKIRLSKYMYVALIGSN